MAQKAIQYASHQPNNISYFPNDQPPVLTLPLITAIVVIGLDDSGKTSIVNQLKIKKPGYLPQTMTTIGANVTNFSFPTADITIVDLGGRQPTRSRWYCYYFQAQAFIFVVSCTDAARLLEAREELHTLQKYRETWGRPILVMVNKSEGSTSLGGNGHLDPHAAPIEFVSAALEVSKAGFPVWGIKPVSALTGEGLAEAFEWIIQQVEIPPPTSHKRRGSQPAISPPILVSRRSSLRRRE